MKNQERITVETKQLFCRGLAQLDIALPDKQVHQLVLYCLELQKWNRRVNLVAKNTSIHDLVEKHFLDSLTLRPVLGELDLLYGPLLDVGSGAGFPGLVVKIACPTMATVLLEPRNKKVAFLRHIIRRLSLDGIDVLANRTEDREELSKHKFSIITGRAVADVPGFLGMVADLVARQTLVICMQGETGKENWQIKETVYGFECIDVKETVLPFSGIKRYFLIFRKAE